MRPRDFNSLITMFVGGCLSLTLVVMFACTQPAPTVADFVLDTFGGSSNAATNAGTIGPRFAQVDCEGQFVEAVDLSLSDDNVLTGRIFYSQGPGKWKVHGPKHSYNGKFGLNAERSTYNALGWLSNYGSVQLSCGETYNYKVKLDNHCAEEIGDVIANECD